MSETPRENRRWIDRLLCALGMHGDNVWPIGMHRSKCYDCDREWSE